MVYPLRFEPVYMEKVWGGRRLETILGRHIPPDEPIGESWEVSDHPHGKSVVVNGPDRGMSLEEVIRRDEAALLGTRVFTRFGTRFPLLVKYIDAEDKLSVQVHPDDAYAAQHAGELGKTEMWYVLHADPGATLIAGLREGVTAEDFRRALAGGDPAALLHRMPVSTGDSIVIPAGRIHAIMPGLLILEIQQNSDTTYRLYDWNRPGLDGKPRELHVEDAMAVTNWRDYEPRPCDTPPVREDGNRRTLLGRSQYFLVEKYALATERTLPADPGTFRILNCVAGVGSLCWDGGEEPLSFGDSLLLPAALGECALVPHGGLSVVVSSVP